ncbi:MAG: toll/interleukin-1 receptor domain-containing protein [Chloroflexi bacterium]|nr:toll/interleukin-1 receptor domain-containing protein [Chloroflexota bacterium]
MTRQHKQDNLPVSVFISYAHADEALREELEKHLSSLQREGLIATWKDRDIVAGTDWATEIDDAINSASVILLLISADFVASDYCYQIEMRRALERHQAGQARVIPIALRPVDWSEVPFAHLQALPTNAKPVTTWDNLDEALVDVATGIRSVIRALPLRSISTSRATFLRAQRDTMAPEVQRQWAERVSVRGEDMDSITATIVAVLVAGAISEAAEMRKTTIIGAYHTLKNLLAKKFGAKSKVIQAIDHLEAKPDSADRQETLQEEIALVSAQEDAEVLAVADHLRALIGSQWAGLSKFTIHNNALVQGQTIGDHTTISQQFGDMPKV